MIDAESRYPLLVFVTKDVSASVRATISALGCQLVDTAELQLPKGFPVKFERWIPAFTKLFAFEIYGKDKLVLQRL